MSNNTALDRYVDAQKVTADLDELIRQPIYSISDEALAEYESEYFNKKCTKSAEEFDGAVDVIPGGDQHNYIPGYPFPLAFSKIEGHMIHDIDGNEYYDFIQSGGTTVLESNPKKIKDKIIKLLDDSGNSVGLFNEYEYMLASKIKELVPSVDLFRMYSSGTEAAMAALRVARLATGRKCLIKMGGAYHGWSDQLAYSINIPGTKGLQSGGVPNFCFMKTEEFLPNDLNNLERLLKNNRMKGGTAAVFIEPVGPGSGRRPIDADFNQKVRILCNKYGALLIFDETVTGFRMGMGGAQEYFDVMPDLTIFGNVIAGGFSGVGGLGGRKTFMKYLGDGLESFRRKALSGGTLAASPLNCIAGYETLCEMEKTDACRKANKIGDYLADGLNSLVAKHGFPFVVYNIGSIIHFNTSGSKHYILSRKKLWTFPGILKQISNRAKETEYLNAAYMAEGIVMHTGDRMYTNASFTEKEIDHVLDRFDNVLDHVVLKG